jgi:hypothetical protein
MTLRPYEIVGMLIGRNHSNRRDAEHGKCEQAPDDPRSALLIAHRQ